MKLINAIGLKAQKLQGSGVLDYRLWVDSEGNLYVQITENAASGTCSELLFSVKQYAGSRCAGDAIEDLEGFDLARKEIRPSANRNDGAFLKAVLQDLLPEDNAY